MTNQYTKRKAVRNIIGERVREARTSAMQPLTQDQLSGKLAAEGLVLDRVAITKIEGGTRCVFDFEVVALAAVLKVDVRWLLGSEERPLKNGSEVLGSGKPRR